MKRVLAVLFLNFLFCSVPVRDLTQQNVSLADNESRNSVAAHSGDTSGRTDSKSASTQTSLILQVNDWPGKNFIVLPKQQMFINFGYEIYFHKELDKSTAAIDASLELKNHRLRSEKISGHVLLCVQVDSSEGEWLLVMRDSLLGREVYIKTYKSAVKDLALQNDLDNARNRWLGKSVYSKRGVISTRENSGGYGSLRVNIMDSLKVLDVTWGVTPLPVKPLWLSVQAKDGRKGFIPIRSSWNNMMFDLPKDGIPWDEDIFESDPKTLYTWDDAQWELVNNHRVIKDMNVDQVLLSWGKPLQLYQSIVDGVTFECWKYQSQTIYFSDKKVAVIKNE